MSELPYDKLAKYLKGNLTVSERAEVEAWIAADPEHARAFESLQQVWDHSDRKPAVEDFGTDAQWQELEERLLAESRRQRRMRSLSRTLNSAPMRRAYGIAASVAVLVVSYFLLFPADETARIKNEGYLEGVPPLVENPLPEEINLIAVGSVRQVTLPDSSKVWLDAGGSLSYTSDFNEDNRTVRLSGRAFFDVMRDTSRMFVIHARNTRIEVLGTSFNVSAAPEDETVEVTVVTGEVTFAVEEEETPSISLVAAEKGVYVVETATINKQYNDDPDFLVWKEEAPFEEEEVAEEIEEVDESTEEVVAEAPKTEGGMILKTREEMKAEKAAILSSVKHEFRWNKNIVNQTVVRGLITNYSDSAVYKRVIFKIWCQNRKTGKEYIRRFPIDGPLGPGETLSYKKTFLIDWMSKTDYVEVEVESILTKK